MKIARKLSENDMKLTRKTSETDFSLKRKPSEDDIRNFDKKTKVEAPATPTAAPVTPTSVTPGVKKFTLNRSSLSINQLKESFPHIDKQLITQTLGEVNNDLDAAIERLQTVQTLDKMPENVNLLDHDALKEAFAKLKAMYYSDVVQPKIDAKINAQVRKSMKNVFLRLLVKTKSGSASRRQKEPRREVSMFGM